MTQESTSRVGRIAIVLAVTAMVLALSAALIKYIRFGQLDITTIAGGIIIPGIAILLVKSTSVKKKCGLMEVTYLNRMAPPNNSFNASGIGLDVIRKVGCFSQFFPPR